MANKTIAKDSTYKLRFINKVAHIFCISLNQSS